MTSKCKTFGNLVAVVVTLTFCLVASPARAESEGWFSDISDGGVLMIFVGGAAFSYLYGGGLVVAIGNLYYGAKGERATSGWRIQGWVLGGINIALGAAGICFGVSNYHDEGLRESISEVSLLLLAVGAMDIGFTIWSSSHPESKERLSVNPIILQDIEGNPAVGIGLNLVDW